MPLQVVWIADDGTIYGGIDNVVYRSIDGGDTWQPILTFADGTSINCLYVNSQNYAFASPIADQAFGQEGLWRSTNGGASWAKVLTLPEDCSIISMTEDSHGYLYAGVYTTGPHADAAIFKSMDGGATWITVYFDANARHIHNVAVDLANDYVYAAVGDLRVNASWTAYTLRSTNGGASWQQILLIPQTMAVLPVDRDNGGDLVPVARLLTTDYDNGLILRTTDDSNFGTVFDTGVQAYGFWMRRNDLNGVIYASFIGGEHPPSWVAGIWYSTDEGNTWDLYRSFSISTAYAGSPAASNFHDGTVIYVVELDSGYQDSVMIYPDYSQSSMAPSGAGASAVSAAAMQWAILSSLTAVAAAVMVGRKVHHVKADLTVPR